MSQLPSTSEFFRGWLYTGMSEDLHLAGINERSQSLIRSIIFVLTEARRHRGKA